MCIDELVGRLVDWYRVVDGATANAEEMVYWGRLLILTMCMGSSSK